VEYDVHNCTGREWSDKLGQAILTDFTADVDDEGFAEGRPGKV
jgi:hypothetical protein